MEDERRDQQGSNGAGDMKSGDIDSLLDQALVLSSQAKSHLETSNTSKSHAEALLVVAEREALRSAEYTRDKIRAEAREQEKAAHLLREASQQDEKAVERIRVEVRKIKKITEERLIQTEEEAEELRKKLLDESRTAAKQEAERISLAAIGDIQSKVSELQTLKVAISEESEATRIVMQAIALRAESSPSPVTDRIESDPASPSSEDSVADGSLDKRIPKTSKHQKSKKN